MSNGTQMDGLRSAIRIRLREKGISAREASRQAGYNVGFVGDFLEKRAKAPNPIALQKVAEVLGITDPFGNPLASVEAPELSTNHKLISAQTAMVPLFSVAAPSGGQFMRVPDEPAGFVPNLPALEHIGGAYAFAVPNDQNEPRYMPGEVVYVSPVTAPRIGDFVFFRLKDGRAGVSRLQDADESRVVLRSLKASRAVTIATADVVVMHRIVAAVG